MIWDPVNGMRHLQDVLVNEYGLGASLTGWTLHEASAISADGKHIVGYATNPTGGTEGWLVSLESASSILPGDFNGDQNVDAADYTVWRDHLGSDFNLNGNGNEEGASAGIVDEADYAVRKAGFGQSLSEAGGHGQAAPEPSTLLLFSAVAIAMLATCRR